MRSSTTVAPSTARCAEILHVQRDFWSAYLSENRPGQLDDISVDYARQDSISNLLAFIVLLSQNQELQSSRSHSNQKRG